VLWKVGSGKKWFSHYGSGNKKISFAFKSIKNFKTEKNEDKFKRQTE